MTVLNKTPSHSVDIYKKLNNVKKDLGRKPDSNLIFLKLLSAYEVLARSNVT